MTTRAQTMPAQAVAIANPTAEQKGNHISWASFHNRYLSREDGFTYEWHNGQIEKTPTSMDISQFFIWRNLFKFFSKLSAQQTIGGYLVTEADILLNPDRHRRPDIAFLTDAQLDDGVKNKVQVPAFVVEIISPSDKAEKVKTKVKDYLAAGVQVVWNVYPESKEVDIYELSGATFTRHGGQMCSAETVIPGFLISVDDVLRKPGAY